MGPQNHSVWTLNSAAHSFVPFCVALGLNKMGDHLDLPLKIVIVERNNEIFRTGLKKPDRDSCFTSADLLVSKASFLTNVFHRLQILSSFQLSRGYSLWIMGVLFTYVSEEVHDAHTEIYAKGALEKLLQSRANLNVGGVVLPPGTWIRVYYKTSKQNYPVRWTEALRTKALESMVKCRRSEQGPPITVAYEHVRLAPTRELAHEFLSMRLEDEAHNDIGEITNWWYTIMSRILRQASMHLLNRKSHGILF